MESKLSITEDHYGKNSFLLSQSQSLSLFLRRNFSVGGILILILTLILLHLPVKKAQAQFSIDAELRLRAEGNRGYKFLADSNTMLQAYMSQRTRLGMSYKKDKVSMRVVIQDVRAWGGEEYYTASMPYASEQGVDLNEGWLKVDLSDKVAIKAGRQIFAYDDQRILGTRNWNQYGVSYDALKLSVSKEKWALDAAVSYNNMNKTVLGVTDGSNDYFSDRNRIRMLNFLYLKKQLGSQTKLSFLAISSGYKSPVYRNLLYVMGTSGLHLDRESERSSITANAFYQFGRNQSGQEVRAWMATLNGGYEFGKLFAGGGIDVYSGKDGHKQDVGYFAKDHVFDPLYGARFLYSGYMNQFARIDIATMGGGLLDIYPFVKYSFKPKQTLLVRAHIFNLLNDVRDYNQTGEVYFNQFLGTEVDLMYSMPLLESMSLKAGFSWFDAGKTFEIFRGIAPGESKPSWWGWLMITYKPVLFQQ